MTIEEIIHVFEYSKLTSENFTDEAVTAAYVAGLAALRAQQEAEKNEPLTLEELREMHGEPVWISSLGIYKKSFRSEWAINDCELGRAESMGTIYRAANYGKTWLAYRRPPTENGKAWDTDAMKKDRERVLLCGCTDGRGEGNMRGPKFPKIYEKPGTCGDCAHFGRFHNGVAPMASGKCKIKPNRWAGSQCAKACKEYKGKEIG